MMNDSSDESVDAPSNSARAGNTPFDGARPLPKSGVKMTHAQAAQYNRYCTIMSGQSAYAQAGEYLEPSLIRVMDRCDNWDKKKQANPREEKKDSSRRGTRGARRKSAVDQSMAEHNAEEAGARDAARDKECDDDSDSEGEPDDDPFGRSAFAREDRICMTYSKHSYVNPLCVAATAFLVLRVASMHLPIAAACLTTALYVVTLDRILRSVGASTRIPAYVASMVGRPVLLGEAEMDRCAASIYSTPTDLPFLASVLLDSWRFAAHYRGAVEDKLYQYHEFYFYRATVTHPDMAVDARLSNQRVNKSYRDHPDIHRFDVLDVQSGSFREILCEDNMVEQSVVKLFPLDPAERRLMRYTTTRNVTDLKIYGKWFRAVVFGSHLLAEGCCLNQDVYVNRPSQRTLRRSHWIASVLPFAAAMLFVIMGKLQVQYAAMPAGPHSALVETIVIALAEEALKNAATRLGVSFHAASLLLGLIEFDLREYRPSAVPAFLMHVFCSLQGWRFSLTCHLAFNGYVAFLTSDRFNQAQCLVEDFLVTYARGTISSRLTAGSWSDWVALTDLGDAKRLLAGAVATACRMPPDTFEFLECLTSVAASLRAERPAAGIKVEPAALLFGLGMATSALTGALAAQAPLKRLYACGFRLHEVTLARCRDHSARIHRNPMFFVEAKRRTCSSTLGFPLNFVAPIIPDFNHGPTVLEGCLARFCRKPPPISRGFLRGLRRYTRRRVRQLYTPISTHADVSRGTWLAQTNYNQARVNELCRADDDHEPVLESDKVVKGFAKRQNDLEYKQPRGINSPLDKFKVATGPFFKIIEDQVYHQPCLRKTAQGKVTLSGDVAEYGPYIKHVPVHLRPDFIRTLLTDGAGRYYETDYSQFEKHFTPAVMNNLEMVLYRHMLQNYPHVYELIHSFMCGQKTIKYKWFTLRVWGKRMSGEMCTSLGNGFSNRMLAEYIAYRKGGSITGVVEGDDALFVSTVPIDKSDFEGFDIKVKTHSTLLTTSFCGLEMSTDNHLMRDPRRILTKFAWSFSPYRDASAPVRMGLLRAKALSLAYECPRCPVVSALAKRVLEYTRGTRPRFGSSYWERSLEEWVKDYEAETSLEVSLGPTQRDRIDFYELYDITPALQLELERRIARWDGQPLDDALFAAVVDLPEAHHFRTHYVGPTPSLATGSWDNL